MRENRPKCKDQEREKESLCVKEGRREGDKREGLGGSASEKERERRRERSRVK